MKPYRETHTFEGVLDAPIERVWALHTNPEEMCSVFPRIIETEIVSGQPGEKGCLLRSTMGDPSGRTRTVDTEFIDVHPPRSISTRTAVRRAPRMVYESTRTFERQGDRTPTTLTITAQTHPVLWFVRLLPRLTRAKRARETQKEFERETAEENAYYARLRRRDGGRSSRR